MSALLTCAAMEGLVKRFCVEVSEGDGYCRGERVTGEIWEMMRLTGV